MSPVTLLYVSIIDTTSQYEYKLSIKSFLTVEVAWFYGWVTIIHKRCLLTFLSFKLEILVSRILLIMMTVSLEILSALARLIKQFNYHLVI